MKTLVMAMLTAATIATTVNAQPPAPEVAGKMPPNVGRERGMRPLPAGEELQQVTTFEGKAIKMIANDDYMYDGFYMLNGSDTLQVKFPPHLGSEITALVKSGTNVTGNGVLHNPPLGGKEIRMVSLTANGKTIIDVPPAITPTPPVEKFVQGDGKITSLQSDREGRVKGFIVDNKTILRIPPHVAMQLGSMAQTGVAIAFTGMHHAAKQGEVAAADYTIIHCNTITVNGRQYLVK